MTRMSKNVETVERERELHFRKISFIKYVKKYIKIKKDGLYAKENKLLQNSLSFLCALEVIETKDKYV